MKAIEIEQLSSHWLSLDRHPDLFAAQTPTHRGMAPFVLDTIRADIEGEARVFVLLSQFVSPKNLANRVQITHQNQAVDFELVSVGKAPALAIKLDHPSDLILKIDNSAFSIDPSAKILDKFAGKNTAILVLNDHRPLRVKSWLNWMKSEHDLQAAIIFDRIQPDGHRTDLTQELANLDLEIAVIDVDFPIGKMTFAEDEIYGAPDAPGKEKMQVPEVDPWRAPLANSQLLEIAKFRFLRQARAVLFTQPNDIIDPGLDGNIFDRTRQDPEGYQQLFGKLAYPWRIRKNRLPDFSDHLCVRFDSDLHYRSWCLDPRSKRAEMSWNLYRVGAFRPHLLPKQFDFWRMAALCYTDRDDHNPNLAPKTSLVIDPDLHSLMKKSMDANPVMPPEIGKASPNKKNQGGRDGRRLIVTTMKNEGPFILEWIAYHKAIGFDDFLVYTNDCTDGTDTMLDLLAKRGIVKHLNNPFRNSGLKPQHAAIFDAAKQNIFKNAAWKICMDCDEYVNIHVGDGTLDDLFQAIGDANLISLTWRLFGNGDVVEFTDRPIIEQFTRCAPKMCRAPHQAWGVKTLYHDLGYYRKMGVHRPKGLVPSALDRIKWVNGSGQPMPEAFKRTGWRTGTGSVGYDLVTLNHYAVRSMESFLVKRDRGRVNHVDRDQGLEYWFRMNHNVEEDHSIQKHVPKMRVILDEFMADPTLTAQHQKSVQEHQEHIQRLLESPAYQEFYQTINSQRLRDLARHTDKIGNNVFMIGPQVIGDPVVEALKNGKSNYFNVRPDGQPFDNLVNRT